MSATAHHVLVVDDDAMVRSVVVSLLKRGGFSTMDVASGPEAIALLRNRPGEIACVIVDYSMPGMRGDEVLKEVRRIAPGVPVVMASGYTDRAPAADEADRPDHLLPKPFDGSTLLKLISGLLA